MKQRSLGKVVTLGFVTLGIYCFYWFYATRKDIIATNGNPKSVPHTWLLLLLFPAYVVAANVMAIVIGVFPSSDQISGVLLGSVLVPLQVIILILPMALPLWWIWKFSGAIVPITRRRDRKTLFWMSVPCVAWWLMPVWQLIVQEDINKSLAANAQPATPAAPHSHE